MSRTLQTNEKRAKDASPSKTHPVSGPSASEVPWSPAHAAQQAYGNRAVSRLLNAGIIQASLKIGAPNDEYEQEADRIAEQVMRMPEPGLQRKPV